MTCEVRYLAGAVVADGYGGEVCNDSRGDKKHARMSGDPDEDLMAKISRGDIGATQLLVSKKLPRMLSLAKRMLGDATEAEDVAQETLIRVWKQAANWVPGKARLDTWMHKVALNLCYDRLRRRKDTVPSDDLEMDDGQAGPSVQLEQKQTAEQVATALDTLPERQRLAIVLCYYQELSNIEAATLMNISVDALESLLARGRRHLKTVLSPEQADTPARLIKRSA
ncbi:RNA polymerase sigma factor [Asticcacaulis sp. LKC15W]|uniref:RNA polymerase sigma factor n=2 Tax=Asticcacaulis machinosus TaxID=2984211 RepID=A0ABT5HI85_9CAUL|nr:RNA polymerase sigma factor [Asticcacaulis machinosus]MDC7675959.1 RNA polymerase sigma factor [Asticcacaulis machinosus]